MANRFNRLNIEFDLEALENRAYNGIENDGALDSFDDDDESLNESRSSASSASLEHAERAYERTKRPKKNHREENAEQHRFRVYANPFARRLPVRKKNKKKQQSNRDGGSVNATAITILPAPIPAAAPNQAPNGAQSDPWVPHSISEDVTVFEKYGIDPKHANHHGKGCFGCNVRCDNIPVKQSNMKVLLEKIAQSGLQTGNMLERAKTIRSNYLDLIVTPKRKLCRLLHSGSEREGKGEEEEEEEEESDECRPHKRQRTESYGTHVDKNDGARASVDEWDTVQIYNHLRRHQMNVIDQVQYRRAKLWDILEEMERNSLFVKHDVKKNALGESLTRADPDQMKIYLAIQDKWLALSKSRPDLMRPFYDPDKANQQGTANTREAEGEIINVSGQLLFGKKTRQ